MRDVIIATFHSENCPSGLNWIATLYQYGRRLPLFITGKSEEFIVAEARRLWDEERAKHLRETGKESPVFARLASEPVIDTVPPEAAEPETVAMTPGASKRGGNRAGGLIWMVNAERTERGRVPESELASYLAKGWVRGGPRTKLVTEAAA